MFTCKQIAKMLSEKKLSEMTLSQKMVDAYVKLCSVCVIISGAIRFKF